MVKVLMIDSLQSKMILHINRCPFKEPIMNVLISVVVLETGLGLETSLETSLFRLGLGLGLELSGLGLDLGLEPSGLGFFGRDQHETSN